MFTPSNGQAFLQLKQKQQVAGNSPAWFRMSIPYRKIRGFIFLIPQRKYYIAALIIIAVAAFPILFLILDEIEILPSSNNFSQSVGEGLDTKVCCPRYFFLHSWGLASETTNHLFSSFFMSTENLTPVKTNPSLSRNPNNNKLNKNFAHFRRTATVV